MPDFVYTHQLLQQIFSQVFLLSYSLQLLTGFIILTQQIGSFFGQINVRTGLTVSEPFRQELSRSSRAIQRRRSAILNVLPEVRFELDEHRNQLIIALDTLPFEAVPTYQNRNKRSLVTSHSHVVLNLQLVLVRNGIFPFTSLKS